MHIYRLGQFNPLFEMQSWKKAKLHNRLLKILAIIMDTIYLEMNRKKLENMALVQGWKCDTFKDRSKIDHQVQENKRLIMFFSLHFVLFESLLPEKKWKLLRNRVFDDFQVIMQLSWDLKMCGLGTSHLFLRRKNGLFCFSAPLKMQTDFFITEFRMIFFKILSFLTKETVNLQGVPLNCALFKIQGVPLNCALFKIQVVPLNCALFKIQGVPTKCADF